MAPEVQIERFQRITERLLTGQLLLVRQRLCDLGLLGVVVEEERARNAMGANVVLQLIEEHRLRF
ncbi:hypothetical protein PCA_12995 [Rhodanobacter sp. PCA2]|nr:hypothetical protein [Rhodanobacter sp. PCA2]